MKRLTKLLVLALILYSPLLFSAYQVVEDQMTEVIKTPDLQSTKRAKIVLDNGLEAFLVSDPGAKKSGASLAVGIGNSSEPHQHVGLAHYVEHMLFMGTEKYPNEAEYHEFMKTRGGSNNAYTALDRTVYMFDISNGHLSEALDRFSTFFVCPLFDQSCLDRELKAIDQEFQMRVNNDHVRSFQVMSSMMKQDSNLNTWRCGNAKTLNALTRDELVAWYSSHYSSDRMKLVVYGAMPLEEMMEKVDECFSQVKRTEIQVTQQHYPVCQQDKLGKKVFIEPVSDIRYLIVNWEMPTEFVHDFNSHTHDLVSLVLGEESSTSLASALKKQNLINGIECDYDRLTPNIGLFSVMFDLTDKGLENHDEVIAMTYDAINSLKKSGIPRYKFDEMVSMAKLRYQFQSRPEVFGYVSSLASNMLYESLESFPQKTLWPSQYDGKKVTAFLEELKPEKAIYYISASSDLTAKSYDRTEPMLNIEHTYETISQNQLAAWATASQGSNFSISPPNPYIPTKLDLVTSASDVRETPEVVYESPKAEVLYQADQSYLVPQSGFTVLLQSPKYGTDVQSNVLKDLYLVALQDAILPQLELGSLAGIHTSISISQKLGLNLTFNGYSQKMPLLASKVLQEVKGFVPQQKDFERFKNSLQRDYANASKTPPYQQSAELVTAVLLQDYNSAEAKLEQIKNIDFETFRSYCKSMFEQVYIRALASGNFSPYDAMNLAQNLEQEFDQSAVFAKENHPKLNITNLDQIKGPQYLTKTTDQAGNSIRLVVGHGELSHDERASFEVMTKAISTPFFDTIRTKQQVGYVVGVRPLELENSLYTVFIAQSNSYSNRDLLSRFELFNEQFMQGLGTDFTPADFDNIKAALIENYEKPPTSLAANHGELIALTYTYADYDWKAKRIEALKNLSFNQFVQFCQTQLGKSNYKRVATFIDGDMSAQPNLNYNQIHNLNLFKAECSYKPVSVHTDFIKKWQELELRE